MKPKWLNIQNAPNCHWLTILHNKIFFAAWKNIIFLVAKGFASPVVFYSRLVFVIAAKTEML